MKNTVQAPSVKTLNGGRFENILQTLATNAGALEGIITDIIMLDTDALGEIKAYLIGNHKIDKKLQYTKKVILKEYLIILQNEIHAIKNRNKLNKLVLRAINAALSEINTIINTSAFLVDFSWTRYDTRKDRVALIKLAERLTSVRTSANISFDTFSNVVFRARDNYDLSCTPLFSKTALKEFSGARGDDGCPIMLAGEMLRHLKHEIEANNKSNTEMINEARRTFDLS